MIGQPFENFHQRAALFAGPNHVHKQVRKNLWLLGHGVGKAPALHHLLLELATDAGGNALAFQVRHAVQSHGQGHAALEQIRELLRERRQLLQFRFAPAP